MTFKWQGRIYNTAEMSVFETENPAMPEVYVGFNGEVFVVEIDRLEGIEVRLAGRDEAIELAQRHGFLSLLANADQKRDGKDNSSAKHHALIVEDDGLSRHTLAKLLHRSGYETTFAATVAEAEAKLYQSPKWVILDLQLPDGRGTVLLERIRSKNLPIKIAITTGETDQDLLSQVSCLGPDVIFRKPLDLSKIVHWLDAA